MQNNQYMRTQTIGSRLSSLASVVPSKTAVGLILIVALIAFEIFNFDTTKYALHNLIGDVRFVGMQWAAILAVAFCAIDFAGLVRLFTPERGLDEPKEVWYLMGAWLLGATMNAVMTWWVMATPGAVILSRLARVGGVAPLTRFWISVVTVVAS